MLDRKMSLGCDEAGCTHREDIILTMDDAGSPEIIFENAEIDPESWKESQGFWLCPTCYEARQQRQSAAPPTGRRKLNVGASVQQIPAPPVPAPYNFTPQAPQVQMQAPPQLPAQPQGPVAARPVQVNAPQPSPAQQQQAAPMVIHAPMHNPGQGQINMAQPTPQPAQAPLTINAPMNQPTTPTVAPQINMAQTAQPGSYLAPVPLEKMPFKFEVDGPQVKPPSQ